MKGENDLAIYLCDNANDGHHDIYQRALLGLEETIELNNIMNFTSVKRNFIKGYCERRRFIKHIIHNIPKIDSNPIIHFLYLDSLYKCPFISKSIAKSGIKKIATLHWIPNDKFSIYLLKKFAKQLDKIIVHSEFLLVRLNEMGIKNCICIDYPSFICKSNLKEVKIYKDNRIVISCLGGTRYDKGIDILVESFKYITEGIKKDILFNISGIEQDIKFDWIEQEAKKYNIPLLLENKFLTDEEYQNKVFNSHIILLPYRKIFNGNSGPMTDGVYLKKMIIGPDSGNLGYLIKKYKLGVTFKQEDERDLARVISKLKSIDLTINTEYYKDLDVSVFLEKHVQLYSIYL